MKNYSKKLSQINQIKKHITLIFEPGRYYLCLVLVIQGTSKSILKAIRDVFDNKECFC